jgi:monothiol glutaredoxin
MTQLYPHVDIKRLIDEHPIIIFGKGEKGQPFCGFTAQVQTVFEDLGLDYEMINILKDQNLRTEMKAYSDWPTFPQVYLNGEFIGGCDIVLEMQANKQFLVE